MLHLLQMGPSKVLTTFFIQTQSSWQLSLLELPPFHNTVTPFSDSSDMYTSTEQSGPPLLMLHSRPTLVSKPLMPHLLILYFLPLPPHHHPLLLAALLRLLPPLLSLTLLDFFNGMVEVFEPGALNYFTFSCPTLSTLFVSRNPILPHLFFSRFLDSLLCVLITPTLGQAFSLLMPRTLAAALSFSSGRAYLFLNFPLPLFLLLIPTLIMYGSSSLLTTPPRCHFLMCMPPYSLLPNG